MRLRQRMIKMANSSGEIFNLQDIDVFEKNDYHEANAYREEEQASWERAFEIIYDLSLYAGKEWESNLQTLKLRMKNFHTPDSGLPSQNLPPNIDSLIADAADIQRIMNDEKKPIELIENQSDFNKGLMSGFLDYFRARSSTPLHDLENLQTIINSINWKNKLLD
jgi:hypothetical protein